MLTKVLAVNVFSKLALYLEITKPRIVSLIVFAALTGFVLGSRLESQKWSWVALPLMLTAVALAAAGCSATTSYTDRDIDAVMERTKHRPVPSGRIRPPEKALGLGVVLILLGLGLSLSINMLSFIWLLAGVLDNVVVYSMILKRSSSLNIILGGLSGGFAVLFGWTAATGSVAILPILVALLVVAWIPGHIWCLAFFTRADYERAGVPMLPVVVSPATALRLIVATVMLMVSFSIIIAPIGRFGAVYLVSALMAGLVVTGYNLLMLFQPSEERAYTAFKISSPYLFLLFVAMIVDGVVL